MSCVAAMPRCTTPWVWPSFGASLSCQRISPWPRLQPRDPAHSHPDADGGGRFLRLPISKGLQKARKPAQRSGSGAEARTAVSNSMLFLGYRLAGRHVAFAWLAEVVATNRKGSQQVGPEFLLAGGENCQDFW